MAEVKEQGNIIVPTLKVNEGIKFILEDISRSTAEAEKISVLNPISAYRKLSKYNRLYKDMTSDYNRLNE
jgi:hypothetical protein